MAEAGSVGALPVSLSLLVIAAISLGVVVDVEANYAAVTAEQDDVEATVADVHRTEGGLDVHLTVDNAINRPLRVQYVFFVLDDGTETRRVSVPFKGSVSLSPGTDGFSAFVQGRRLAGLDLDGGPFSVGGYVAVAVYNDHRFEVPIEETEVRV